MLVNCSGRKRTVKQWFYFCQVLSGTEAGWCPSSEKLYIYICKNWLSLCFVRQVNEDKIITEGLRGCSKTLRWLLYISKLENEFRELWCVGLDTRTWSGVFTLACRISVCFLASPLKKKKKKKYNQPIQFRGFILTFSVPLEKTFENASSV